MAIFDPVTYFNTLNNTCVLTKDKYKFSRISGLAELEEVLQNRKRSKYFTAVQDSEEGATVRGGGRGYFDRRPATVFLCAIGKQGDMTVRETLIAELREVYRAFLSKIIKDKSDNGLMSIDTTRFPFFEIPGFFADGCVGIYFMMNADNPVDLSYDASQWT